MYLCSGEDNYDINSDDFGGRCTGGEPVYEISF